MTTKATILWMGEFRAWYESLTPEQAALVDFSAALLEDQGVRLGHPHSSGFPGSRLGIRELRILNRTHPIRVFYAFNPRREAVLILGGNKKGEHDESKWTAKMLRRAEAVWEAYLAGSGWKK